VLAVNDAQVGGLPRRKLAKGPLHSILSEDWADAPGIEQRLQPECFSDLRLDQIVAAVIAGREAYDLTPIFWAPLPSVEAIGYRQAVFRDFEAPAIATCVTSFAERMRGVHALLEQSRKFYFPLQKQRLHLDAIGEYCRAVTGLSRAMAEANPGSRGLLEVRRYLDDYMQSEPFQALSAETGRLQTDLADIIYTVRIDGKRVEVSRYAGERDYAAEVLETFAKFRQAEVQGREFTFRSRPEMNHVEEAILQRVSRLYPEIFSGLARHCERHCDFPDPGIVAFDRDAQFFLAWLEYLAPLKKAGLRFCYPVVSERADAIRGLEMFDLALARQLVAEGGQVVVNDFELHEPERILVVSGANQGGKTTFARAIGQMHYLASLGCPIPGREGYLSRVDQTLTHFEREERVETLRGKLEESLERMRVLLERATARSLLIMNESFDATTVSDALYLNRQVLRQVMQRDLLCVCVTFLDELASLSEETASFVAQVDPQDPAKRTFKVLKRPAEGLAHAMAIARKHGLTYERVKERLKP
jgi:hypothetical protein